jgi:uncharacterized protein with PhoU and TrkA domain
VRVGAASAAAGRSLAELNLRGRTGATAVALRRGGADDPIVFPTAKVILHEGDLLALSGSHEAIAEAVRLLESGGTAEWRSVPALSTSARLHARDTSSPRTDTDATAPPGARW